MLVFDPLTESEIECRVQQITEKGVSLLLYKDARCDMKRLDKTIGAERWQREHYAVKNSMFCKVGIFLDGIGWVWKSDCGTESNTEAQKGEASDSFKRACFNWGIGRELYTAPRIWISAQYCDIKKNNNGKFTCYDRFEVEKIRIEDYVITGLSIVRIGSDNKPVRCFTWVKQ